jgi:hypothetical protein
VFRYQVDVGAGERDVLSLLESDWVFQHGLHPDAVMAVVRHGGDSGGLAPTDIEENPPFLRLLSKAIFESVDRCAGIKRQAEIQGSGYVYLLDQRTPDPGGKVSPENIVGAVEVRSGELVAGSYKHNPRHRLLTAAGWFQLPNEIEAALQGRLRDRTLPR